MFKSIQTRTMFFLVALAVCLIIIISYILIAGMEKVGHNMKESALMERTVLLSHIVENRSSNIVRISPEEAYEYIISESGLSKTDLASTFLLNKSGEMIGLQSTVVATDSDSNSFTVDNSNNSADPNGNSNNSADPNGDTNNSAGVTATTSPSAAAAARIPYDLNVLGNNSSQYIYKDGENYIVGVSSLNHIPGLENWFICSEESFTNAFGNINKMKSIVIFLVVLFLFILWPMARRLSFSIANPIKDLSLAASQIAAGDISHGIVTHKNDELSDIASSFNLMLHNLKSAMQQVLSKSGEAASMKEIMEYVEQAYDNLPGGVISINNIGDITTFNEVSEELFGIRAEELLGLDIKNPIPKEIKPIIDALRRCLSKGSFQLKTLADVYNVFGEKIPILYSVNIQFGLKNEVLGAICVFRRIEDIERFEESAVRAKNLEALGEMAASLAHEIKNPLTSIRGYTQLINMELSEKNINLDELDIIIHETDRLTLMLDRFLKFARPKVPELSAVDLRKLVTYVISLTKTDLPENIKIATTFMKIPPVMLDSELFEPVVLNLILNAIQALPNGGNIAIRTGYSHQRKMVYLEFIDDGIGIPIELSEKIFQPFFTTKESGVGMGLAISSRIIEAHKGILEVESVVGKMTKFTILLPSG
ncbi:MAG TPA: ATP-binding protein [Anaerovoracaceae bacterium]|nr:ATP-binding protein [Anaerovoracaceae bacterium]